MVREHRGRKINTGIRGTFTEKGHVNGNVQGHCMVSGKMRSPMGLVQGEKWCGQSLKGSLKTVYKEIMHPVKDFGLYPTDNKAKKNDSQTYREDKQNKARQLTSILYETDYH